MMRDLIRPMAGAVVAALVFTSAIAPAQEPASTETPAAETAPAEAADGSVAPAAASAAEAGTAPEAAASEPLATIPVAEEAADVATGSRHPYTWAAARLAHFEYNEQGADGFGVEGSYLLLPDVYAIGSYILAETDDANSVRVGQFELGAGYRLSLTPAFDFNGAIRLVKTDRRSDEAVSDGLGYRFELGVRGTVLPQLEGAAAVSYVEGNRTSHAYLIASALYAVLPRLSIGAESTVAENSMAYAVLGRWAF